MVEYYCMNSRRLREGKGNIFVPPLTSGLITVFYFKLIFFLIIILMRCIYLDVHIHACIPGRDESENCHNTI